MAKNITVPLVLLLIFIIWLGNQNLFAQAKLDVGGYMQTWYIANERHEIVETSQGMLPVLNTRTIDTQGFRIRRARLVARGSINENFSAATWVEFAGATPSLLCFYADAHIKPWFNVRIGQFIMPGQPFDTGRLGSSSLIFYERPSVTTRLSNVMGFSAFRDIGIMAYGSHGRLWYGIQAGNGMGRFNHAGSSITERNPGSGLYGGRIDYEFLDGFTLGGHISTNRQRDVVQNGEGPFDINRTSYSFRAKSENIGIHGLFSQFEYMYVTANDEKIGSPAINNGKFNLHGFYAELGYKLSRNWHILGRYDEMVEKPGQATQNMIENRSLTNNYTLGITRFLYHEDSEIVRAHLNYSFGETGPMQLDNSMFVLAFQVRFLP